MHTRNRSQSECVGNRMKAAGLSFPYAECAGLGHNDYLHQDQSVHWFVHNSTGKTYFPTVVLFTNEACFIGMGFSTATITMFGQKQTLMLHLFTATNNAFGQHVGRKYT